MSIALGKRKRLAPTERSVPQTASSSSSSSTNSDQEGKDDDAEAARAAFARAFEAKFAPLENIPSQKTRSSSVSSASSASDFGGFDESDSDDEPRAAAVQVVTHSDAVRIPSHLTKAQQKAFMTSTAPTSSSNSPNTQRKSNHTKGNDDEEDAPTEALNLKNDLALQRLISESHLLDPTKQPARNQRQRVADLRLQALGSKGGILKQENMPMAFRKGIAAKKKQREEDRRRDARENGIILEKQKFEQTKSQERQGKKHRERGIGGPSVGRFKGGTLQLSRQDVQAIKGPGRGNRGSSRGKRR